VNGTFEIERHGSAGASARGRLVFALLLAAALLPVSFFRVAEVSGEAAYRIDPNSAGAAELTLLPGIGPDLAAKIVNYRKNHGPFSSASDLGRVKGIGPAKTAGMAPWIRLE
jgi:competence ComEA-like helix-hairpin-helix protein